MNGEAIKQWFRKSLFPLSTAAEDFTKEWRARQEERANRPKEEDPEQALFKSMCERADEERQRIANLQRDNGVRYIARQILTVQAKDLNPRTQRFSQRDAADAMEIAIRIYDLIENTSTEPKREE